MDYNINLNKPQPSLIPFTQARRPYPQYIGATMGLQDGRTKYDAMTIEVQKKVGDVTFDAHWTWGNSFADYLNLENPYSHVFWNRDGLTPRHRFVGTVFWNLPVGRGKSLLGNSHRVVDLLAGSWLVSFQSLFQTGMFFSPSYSGADRSNTNTVGGMPDRLSNGNLAPDGRTVDRWFDTAAFAPPPAGRFGSRSG